MSAAPRSPTSNAPRPAQRNERPAPIADLRYQALAMHDAGYSIIPVYDKLPYDPEKRPYRDTKTDAWVTRPRLSWERYKTSQPLRSMVQRWFDPDLPLDRQPNGIGLLSGAVSGGVCVLDFETVTHFMAWKDQVAPALYAQLCIVRTGRGYHAIFKCPNPRTGHAELVDGKAPVEVRGEGLYIAAVNSWHPEAKRRYTLEQGSVCKLAQLDQADADRLILLAIPTLELSNEPRPATTPSTSKPKLTPTQWIRKHTTRRHTDNLTAAQIRAAFNARYDVRDLIVEYGGRLQHGRVYHCPCTTAHANGDRNGSLVVSTSSKPERYGTYVCGCYNSACPLHTSRGKVIAAFDLMQHMEGLGNKEAVFAAVQRLGIAREPRPAPAPLPKPLPEGRPRKLTDLEYRKRAAQLADGRDEHGNPRVLLSCAELAAKLDMSPRTAQRIEQRLRRRLLWERHQLGRCGSVATVLPGVATSRGDKTTENSILRGDKTTEITPVTETSFTALETAENKSAEKALKACNVLSAAPAAPIAPVVQPEPSMERTPEARPEQKSHASGAAAPAPDERTAGCEVLDDEPEEAEQLAAFPVKRKRPLCVKLDTVTPAEQVVELKRRIRKAQHAASRAEWIGHTSQRRAITKRIIATRAQLAAVEASLPPPVPVFLPPSLFDVPLLDPPPPPNPTPEAPAERATLAQDAPKVLTPPIAPAIPEMVSLDAGGWRHVLNPDGRAGWRGVHPQLGQTGLYIGREGMLNAIERGNYAAL